MAETNQEASFLKQSKPLQTIKTVEQSLNILKHKLAQMNKKEAQNIQQISKIFYSSIPLLKHKLSQSLEFQKNQSKKKNLFNQTVLREKTRINRQRKLINEKQIQRNRQLINMMKMNQHNTVKQMSRKNQIYIQKMKSHRLQQNRMKKQLIKGSMENSRMKIQYFHNTKAEDIRRQKQNESIMAQKKVNQMAIQFEKLANKQNQTVEKVDKTDIALRNLRSAVDKLQKMNDKQFVAMKNKIKTENTGLSQEEVVQNILLKIIESSNESIEKRKTLHNSRWSSGHLLKKA